MLHTLNLVLYVNYFSLKNNSKVCGDFSGGPVVKNPPFNAGDTGSIPGWGTKVPHAVGATKPVHHNC